MSPLAPRPPPALPSDLSRDPLLPEGLRGAAALFEELVERGALSALGPRIAPLCAERLGLELTPAQLQAALIDGPGLEALEPFCGDWAGSWGELTVLHRWGSVDPAPCAIEAGGFVLRRVQVAWVGDGFGYNFEVSRADVLRALLGAVFHLAPVPRDDIEYLTPHVGLALGHGRVVWLTPKHAFFERVDPRQGRYEITQYGWTLEGGAAELSWIYATTYRRE